MTIVRSANIRPGLVLVIMALLAGCATPGDHAVSLPRSVLQSPPGTASVPLAVDAEGVAQGATADSSEQRDRPVFTRVSALAGAELKAPVNQDGDSASFSDVSNIELRLDQLPLRDFIHQVFDQLLDVSYVVDQQLESRMQERLTLNLQQPVSQRELFRLVRRVLADKQIDVLGRDGVYFLTQLKGGDNSRDLRIGVGSRALDVPESDGQVLQIVPVRFGAPRGFQVVLKSLFSVEVSIQDEKQMLFIQGAPNNVRRALDMLALLDAPASRAQEVGLVDLVYLEPQEFLGSIEELMAAEGITVGRAGTQGPVALVALPRRQAVVVFASDSALLQRVMYWARQLDVPGQTTELSYFLYKPVNARAIDMGESLERLLNLGSGGYSSRSSSALSAPRLSESGEGSTAGVSGSSARSSGNSLSASTEDLSMVVDERQNQLMFQATPAAYDKLRPLLQRLDVAPPQVALEVMVAEVTLTGELQYGLEWFLQKNNYSIGTLGALGIGSSALNITGIDADAGLNVIANLSETENMVNVLSRPRIVVSDGGSATVNVGTDVPILTSTASDVSGGELGSTIVQTVQYRSTGVVLSVTPTVNGQGVVSLELSQEISNTSSDAIPGINSPVISQRSFNTTLMVGDGQTAVVGGLISDNNASGQTAVPGLSRIPLLGHLFRSNTRGRDKTEIVVMITPRIITSTSQLDDLAGRLLQGMEQLTPAVLETESPGR